MVKKIDLLLIILLSSTFLFTSCTVSSRYSPNELLREGVTETAVPAPSPTAAQPPTTEVPTATPEATRSPVAQPSATASPASEASHEYYQEGLTLLEAQGFTRELDLARAVEVLSQALDLNPQFAAAYAARSEAYLELGELDLAMQDAQKGIALDPQDDQVQDTAGFIALLQEDYEAALDYFDQAIALNPDKARTYFHRGQVYFFRSNLRAALADYNQALELDPEAPEYLFAASLVHLQLGQKQKALGEVEQAIALDDQEARFHFQRGLILRGQGDLQGALNAYEQAIDLDPKMASAQLNRANILRDLGQLQEALDDYNRAAALDEDNALLFLNRATVKFMLRNYSAALADFDRALALDPQWAWAYQQRGNTRLVSGDAQGAYDDFSRAIKLAETAGESQAGIGRSLAMLGRNEESLDALKASYKNDPDNLHLLTLVGFTLLEIGEPDSALVQFDLLLPQLEESREVEGDRTRTTFLSDDPREAALARFGRGRAQMALEAIEAGMADFRQALRYDSEALLPELDLLINNGQEEMSLFLLRGLILAGQGAWEAARADYQQAIDLGADGVLLSRFLLERGNVAAEQGDFTSATADLQQAIELSPNQPGMLVALGRLYYENGQWQEAADRFNDALDDQEDNIDALAYRGAASAQLGDLEKARDDLCRSMALLEEGAAADTIGLEELELILQEFELDNC